VEAIVIKPLAQKFQPKAKTTALSPLSAVPLDSCRTCCATQDFGPVPKNYLCAGATRWVTQRPLSHQ
jgi:hypothetical protein